MGEHVLARLADTIGSAIEVEHNMEQLKKMKNQKMLRTQMSVHELHSKGKLFNTSLRKVLAKVAAKELNNDVHWKPKWPQSVKLQIGALLSTLLMKCATGTVRMVNAKDPDSPAKTAEDPAFYHAYRRVRHKKIGVIVFNPALLELLARLSKMQLSLRLLPMIVTPRPWLTWRSGGYLLHEEEVVRLQGNLEHRALVNRAAEEDKLIVVLHSPHVLGVTPWRVTVPVLEVVLECWNSGEEIAGIPPEKLEEIPPPPEDYETNMEAKKNVARQTTLWLEVDKPWQFLANCMELKAALSSDDPLQFASRMHIHQDGTCNGLQHYAALGGDVLGAQHVNLVPSDRPADVYSGVANQVRALVQRAAEAGLREAILIKNHVTRKLVKQLVMTNTYGVTFVGAKDQVNSRP
ncbi:hypothetical protein BJ742DRAFT_877325 [Cladochytrium replicatum]|nr:hypothetical protein BJ742DRAFT_877325 [Cladochytrium replicatum]